MNNENTCIECMKFSIAGWAAVKLWLRRFQAHVVFLRNVHFLTVATWGDRRHITAKPFVFVYHTNSIDMLNSF